MLMSMPRSLFIPLQTQQITPQLALQVLLQFDKAINTALANRVRNRVNFRVSPLAVCRLLLCKEWWVQTHAT